MGQQSGQPDRHDPPDNSPLRYMGVGVEFIAAVGLPLAAGLWLDSRWGLSPLFTLIGLALGFAAGLYRLVQVSGQGKGR
jgi:F0F1-type ATP synthase assembly protein I